MAQSSISRRAPAAAPRAADPAPADGLSPGRVAAYTGANAASVDIEDYFHVSAFAGRIERGDWERLPCRVERNTDRVLALFDEAGARATFFILGWVAERYPDLIRRIAAAGHELASHGMDHVRVSGQDEAGFRADVRRSKRLIEDIGGCAVRGYRAASFSIGAETPWAHAVLADEGYAYSSSIYPIRHDLYGMPDAPRFAYRPVDGKDLRELPITTLRLFGCNLPAGGGGYFRLLPYALSRATLRRVRATDRAPCVFYFHPWEIDPDQPRQNGISVKSRVRHYTNLDRMEGKIRRLLADFPWDRIDRVFGIGS